MDDIIIPINMFGLQSSNFIFGQRIMSPEKTFIKHADDYEKILSTLNIEISFEKRKHFILNEAKNIASKLNGNRN
jgi:glycyl-tRNA synthetase beta subunit